MVSPPKPQKKFTQHKEDEDFDESEFMKSILGIKKPDTSENQPPKTGFFL